MPIAISKSISSRFSPNCNISYWVAGPVTIASPGADAKMTILGYYDQAGYDNTPKGQPMWQIPLVIPAATYAGITTDAELGTYLLTLPQFSGGTAAEAS